MPDRSRRGLVMVLTGSGKGKTTSAFGQVLRAVGHGSRVLVIQFMKGDERYGEIQAARKYLSDLVTIEQHGLDRFVNKDHPLPEDVALARKGLARAREALSGAEYGLVVLDEVNVALDFGLVAWEEVRAALTERRPSTDVILTGRYAPTELVKLADMVSEVLEIKHHYAEGVPAREGIEY